MLTYIIKVTICWAVFYGLYTLLLRKETFFRINRWYLLGTLLIGLLIPFIQWQPSPIIEMSPTYTIAIEPIHYQFQQLSHRVETVAQPTRFDWLDVLLWVYAVGVLAVAIRFLHGVWKLVRLYSKSEVERQGKIKVVYTPDYHLPFSFFNYLFWSVSFEADMNEKAQILRHEEGHIQQWHTLDVLFLELLNIVFWCSPILYFYRKSLRTIHEYLADALVLETTHRKQYGRLLLKQSMSGLQIALANNFINSQLKNRILMMTRKKSSKRNLVRYLAFTPLLLLVFLLFSQKETRSILKSQIDYFKTSDQQLELIFNKLDSVLRLAAVEDAGLSHFFEEKRKLTEQYPKLREEIDLLAHRAAARNNMSFHNNKFRRSSGIMNSNCGETTYLPNYRAPQFAYCNDIRANSAIKKEICREKGLQKFLAERVWIPKEFEMPAGEYKVVHLEVFIDENGDATTVSPRSQTGLEEIAEKIILEVPKWLPAQSDNQPIASSLVMSIVFDDHRPEPFKAKLIQDHFKAAFRIPDATPQEIISFLDGNFSHFSRKHPNHFDEIEDLLFEVLQEHNSMNFVQFKADGNWELQTSEVFNEKLDVIATFNFYKYSENAVIDHINATFVVEEVDLAQRAIMLEEDYHYFDSHFTDSELEAIYRAALFKRGLQPEFVRDEKGHLSKIILNPIEHTSKGVSAIQDRTHPILKQKAQEKRIPPPPPFADSNVLHVLENEIIDSESLLLIINQVNKFESVTTLNSPTAIQKYGEKGKHGAVEYNLYKADEYLLKQNWSLLKVDNFKVTPNPSDGKFQLQFQAAAKPTTITVLGIRGLKVHEQVLEDFDGTFDEIVALSTKMSGSHILIVEQGNQRFMSKLLVITE